MKRDKRKVPATAEELRWYSHEEVFGKYMKDPEFLKAYNEEIFRRQLAAQIRTARASKKLTQKAVAEKSGMSQSVIARLESGERGVTLDTLAKVANALGKRIQLA
jgi:ribosome-binding protein aMBF1 (putative translation factor)